MDSASNVALKGFVDHAMAFDARSCPRTAPIPPERGNDFLPCRGRSGDPHACADSLTTSRRIGFSATISFSLMRCSADIEKSSTCMKAPQSRAHERNFFTAMNAALSPLPRGWCKAILRNDRLVKTASNDHTQAPMKLTSKYFDSIRVSASRSLRQRRRRIARGRASGKAVKRPGNHKAPMGRGRDGEYYHFCVDHVRQYNQTYNYFDGMNDSRGRRLPQGCADRSPADLESRAPTPGPTARATMALRRGRRPRPLRRCRRRRVARRRRREHAAEYRRNLKPLERKSLKVLDLAETATRDEIKTRFKELVKLHHPDANGGDSRSEEKLREIIQAYNYLEAGGAGLIRQRSGGPMQLHRHASDARCTRVEARKPRDSTEHMRTQPSTGGATRAGRSCRT